MREVEDDIAKTEIELKDEIDLKLTDNEMAAHNSAWLTYQESSESLMKSRGIVYSLLLGQCTQVLLNEMEQDIDWAMISGLSDPNLLFELIKRIVLKQSDNQYKLSVVDVAKQECLAQTYTNNSNAETQSTDAESVTLQGVQRDNGDALPSSEVRCTYLEACEVDAQTKYKGNTKVYPFLTPMKECKPIKLSGSAVAVQAKAYVTGGKHGKGKRGTQGYLPDEGRDALSADASPKPIKSQKKRSLDKCDESNLSAISANTNERNKGSSHSQNALGRPEGNPKIVLALKHGTCDKVDTAFVVPCNEMALPKILLDIEVFDRQQIYGAVRVREEQGYSPTAECGLMLNPEGISGCEDTPENVAKRELVMRNPPSETIEDRRFHADDIKFTNWRGRKIDEIPGVEVTAVNVSKNSSVTYPIVEIPGVDIELDVEVTGVNKDLDAEPTGVKVDTGAYGREAYDAVPQDQGNKTKVYGLGQQVPTIAQSKEGKKHKVALTLTRVKHMKHKTAMA